MNRIEDKGNETIKLKPASSTVNQFDLSIAYRLLIGAYIRSAGKAHSTNDKASNQKKSTKQS